MAQDADMQDVDDQEESEMQSQRPPVKMLVEEELNKDYPNRPRNHSKTLPFHDLYLDLFNPLNNNKKKPAGPVVARKKQGPHGPASLTPQEVRRSIIERFISKWRKEVGDDIFPAFRLILPEKDRERAMYGLKEKTIGKLLVRVIKIDKNSEDGYNLLNWKLPGQKSATSMAGDFAGRCYEVLSKRSMQTKPGNMTIEEVNDNLDKLSVAGKESEQLPIMEEFYQRMNAEELTWLIRMILRQMKIGATEKTILYIWHPDAETLFNISSNLRRVCWELYDPSIRLEGEETDITLMQCFQPQLAQFQEHSFDRLVGKMQPTEDDPVFWIEEKLDGERIQLHMQEDKDTPGGMRFGFWSRKAKDYTYLYGKGFKDENSALTQHLENAFHKNVRNIILDGEMITWDPEIDAIVDFGTLKTAALSAQKNPYGTGPRPLYRVFDILYLNDDALTSYTLRDRRRALEQAILPVHRRFELHSYTEATNATEIEPQLRKVVAEASEGLVLKNPRSMYRLNQRNDDWIKVKPEYMAEYGEELDCLVVAGYYGSGRRGGNLSSFLCGLRIDSPPGAGNKSQAPANDTTSTTKSTKFWSFFKVGGGFSASDYATLRHRTEGKWHDWDPRRPPVSYIELGGGDKQYERPDVWIRPEDSFVVSVKAASVAASPQFRTNFTLRFPRFRALRLDKDWQSALSLTEFLQLKDNAEKEKSDKQFVVDDARRKRLRTTRATKKTLVIAGTEAADPKNESNDNGEAEVLFSASSDNKVDTPPVFAGLSFCILTESLKPQKFTKPKLETLVERHGGSIIQTATPKHATSKPVVIADRKTPSVVSLIRRKTETSIIRPAWLFDCITQAKLDAQMGRTPLILPFEHERHALFVRDEDLNLFGLGDNAITGNLAGNEVGCDQFGDAYSRDVTDVGEMETILKEMAVVKQEKGADEEFLEELSEHGVELDGLAGRLFERCRVWFDNGNDEVDSDTTAREPPLDILLAGNIVTFASGLCVHGVDALHDKKIVVTHVVISGEGDKKTVRERAKQIRSSLAKRATTKLPRIVTVEWIVQSWAEKTLLDEQRFAVV